jgi:hypothetical protein
MTKQPRPEDLLNQGTVERFAPIAKVTPTRTPGPFKIEAVNAAQIEAPKPSEYLIKGIVEPAQTSIWFGPPGSGKTFLLLYLAYAIARGEPVFGRRVRQADTHYMALEGRGGIDKRIYALTISMGACPRFWRSAHGLELLQADRNGGARINHEHVDGLIDFIREKAIKMVVIDTLNLTLGGADENSNGDMGTLLRAAGNIAEATGAHIALVAHSAKAGIDAGPRGGGAQKGNADLVVAISGQEIFTATCFAPGKIKDGAEFKLHFKLKVEELARDDEGEAITSCTVEEAAAPLDRTKKALNPALTQAYRELCDLFCSATATENVAPVAGMSIQPCVTPKQVNDRWIETGRLVVHGKKAEAVQKEGQRLRNNLRDLGKIGMNRRYVWLMDRVDTGGQ